MEHKSGNISDRPTRKDRRKVTAYRL